MDMPHWFHPIFWASVIAAFTSFVMIEYRLFVEKATRHDFIMGIHSVLIGAVASFIGFIFIYTITGLVPMGHLKKPMWNLINHQ